MTPVVIYASAGAEIVTDSTPRQGAATGRRREPVNATTFPSSVRVLRLPFT